LATIAGLAGGRRGWHLDPSGLPDGIGQRLEVVGVPRSDKPEDKEETRMAGRFPTFCLRCEHVLHLDHARQWFARHVECPVPECRCRCNFKANPELAYH